jgi:hypothetical protein
MVVSCNAPFNQTTDVECAVRRADGMVLIGSSSVVDQGAAPCSAEANKTATEGPLCP